MKLNKAQREKLLESLEYEIDLSKSITRLQQDLQQKILNAKTDRIEVDKDTEDYIKNIFILDGLFEEKNQNRKERVYAKVAKMSYFVEIIKSKTEYQVNSCTVFDGFGVVNISKYIDETEIQTKEDLIVFDEGIILNSSGVNIIQEELKELDEYDLAGLQLKDVEKNKFREMGISASQLSALSNKLSKKLKEEK